MVHTYVADVPPPDGRKLPNGTILATGDAARPLFYKFTPWSTSLLAFNETDAYARLRDLEDGSGIVELIGISGTEAHFVRVLERSHLGSLDRFLAEEMRDRNGEIEAKFASEILSQIAETMAAIHSLGMVHRDLKAENILLFDADGDTRARALRAKVSDFDRTVALKRGIFLDGPVGSVFHMAPELLDWKQYDRKVDVYAFGILMFELLHGGARPYPNVGTCMPGSISQAEFASKVVNEHLRPNWRHESKALQRLAARCWAANTEERPEFDEILKLLRPDVPRPGSPHSAEPAGKPNPDRTDIDGIGIARDLGKGRTCMEDAACILSTSDALIACVFDGLRGHVASEYAARRFAIALRDAMTTHPSDPTGPLIQTFQAIETALRGIDLPNNCGSTATSVVLQERLLTVSWLGDSPAVLFRTAEDGRNFLAVELIDKHHPRRHDEAARITACDGVIGRERTWLDNGESVPHGPLRVFAPNEGHTGGVALSRALGLFSFKPAICPEPETIQIERQENDLFLVVGSDGLWDVLDTETVYDILVASGSAQQAADSMIDAVLERGAPDNASVIVIDMKTGPDRARYSLRTQDGEIASG